MVLVYAVESKDDVISLVGKVDPQFWENELKPVRAVGMEAKNHQPEDRAN